MPAVRRAAAAVAAALVLSAAPVAQAATPSWPVPQAGAPAAPAGPTVPGAERSPYGPTRLVLSVSPSGANRAAAPRSVTLTCDPAGGRHPYAGDACGDLAAADGGFARLPSRRGMCPMLFAPVTASASGTWRGRTVSWSHEYANTCVLERGTGSVFRF